MHKILFLLLIFTFISCNRDSGKLIVKTHYTLQLEGSENYSHFVYISSSQLGDSSYISIAKKYKDTVNSDLPLESVWFLKDTTDFPRSFNDLIGKQMWSNLIGIARFENDRNNKAYGKLVSIVYYKNGEVYKKENF